MMHGLTNLSFKYGITSQISPIFTITVEIITNFNYLISGKCHKLATVVTGTGEEKPVISARVSRYELLKHLN
jgi:hypothetical protein